MIIPEPAPTGTPRRAAVAFIFITVMLDMLAMGMIIPVLPKIVLGMVADDTAHAARIFGIFGTAWALMQLIFSPVLGALSDRFGRRPVVLFSNFGLGLDYVLMALAPGLGWLFAGRVISGITAASVATASAYIADVTAPEKRAGAFGMLGAAFGVGFVMGPAVGGLLGAIDLRLPFWVAAGLSLANGCYGLFILPESLPVDKRAPFRWRRANPLGALALLRSRSRLLGLSSISFLGNLAHHALPSTMVLYASYRYGWSEKAVGLTLAAMGVCMMAVQGGLVRVAVARFGERRTLITGLVCGILGFIVYGVAATEVWFWAGIPLMALWGLAGPSVQGLMSRRVDADEQGRLQGALSSLTGIAGLIGPGLFTVVFSVLIGPLPGAAFLLAALFLAGAAMVAARVTRGL